MRETLIHDLAARGVGARNLLGPSRVGCVNSEHPTSQEVVMMPALFGQMEGTYATEWAAHARAVRMVDGNRVGWSSVVHTTELVYVEQLRNEGFSISEIAENPGPLCRACIAICRLDPRTLDPRALAE